MRVEKTLFPGLLIIHPSIFGDHRGWFMESYNQSRFEEIGIKIDFIQDNQSYSSKQGTLRGLHFQSEPMAQTKLVRCTRGSLSDVVVDLRKGSPTFLKSFMIELSEANKLQLLVPKGFAHGFVTLSEDTEIMYKVDNYYSKAHDGGIRFDDVTFGIDWSAVLEEKPILSDKDANLPSYDSSYEYFTFSEIE
jgi:dTDP-4-dehydrorhamnose 3,5-epimerase